MEFLINEALELLPFIGLAGTWSYNKPSPFSPFKKKPRQGGEEVFTPDDSEFKYGESAVEQGPYSNTETVDTSNIDFGDEDQVKEIQRAIGVTDDGQWGPNTEKAYQQYINERRGAQGLGQYMYDDLPIQNRGGGGGGITEGINNEPIIKAGDENIDTTGGSVLDPNSEVSQQMNDEDQNKYWGPDALWKFFGAE